MAGNDIEIKITTAAELAALRETQRELERVHVKAKALNDKPAAAQSARELDAVRARLADFTPMQKFGAELLGAAQSVPVLGSAMRALNGTLGLVSAGLLLVAGAGAAARKALDEFAAKETDVARLNQALANSGQFSEEASAGLQALADKYKDLTGIDDSKFIAAARTLLQFGARTDQLDAYLQAVADLAGIMGGDIAAAAQLFGKAMQGSTEMLGRYGIQVDSAASRTDQLDQIMRQAARLGGGQLEATAGTLQRRWTDLKNATSDFWVGLGALIARTGVVQQGLQLVTEVTGDLAGLFPRTIGPAKEFQNRLDGVGDSAEEAARKLDAAKESGEGLAKLKLVALQEEAKKAAARFDELTASIRQAEQAQLAISQAQTAQDLAVIDELESTDSITHAEAARRRVEVKQRGADRETEVRIDSLQAQQRAALGAAEQAGFDRFVVADNLRGEEGSLTAAEAKRDQTEQALETNRRQSDEDQDRWKQERAAAEARLARARHGLGTLTPYTHDNDRAAIYREFDEAKQGVETAQTAQAEGEAGWMEQQTRLRVTLAEANAEIAKRTETVAALKVRLTEATKAEQEAGTAAQARVEALDREIALTAELHEIKSKAAAISARKPAADAAAQDEQAAVLRGIQRDVAPVVEAGASKLDAEAQASGDEGLMKTAKDAVAAARDARAGGTTTGEVEALAKVMLELIETMQAQKRETTSLRRLVQQVQSAAAAQKNT